MAAVTPTLVRRRPREYQGMDLHRYELAAVTGGDTFRFRPGIRRVAWDAFYLGDVSAIFQVGASAAGTVTFTGAAGARIGALFIWSRRGGGTGHASQTADSGLTRTDGTRGTAPTPAEIRIVNSWPYGSANAKGGARLHLVAHVTNVNDNDIWTTGWKTTFPNVFAVAWEGNTSADVCAVTVSGGAGLRFDTSGSNINGRVHLWLPAEPARN